MKHWKTIIGIFIGLTIFGLFLPLIITHISIGLDLGRADANEIGDTIGGILGPYFSFIGSVLLAYTIYLQIEQREDDETKYAVERLRIESDTKEIKQRDFEKVIFENCLESLKKAEAKIHQLNALKTGKSFPISSIINKYFKRDTQSESFTVRFLIDEINSALVLFNENNISSKSYHLIFLLKLEMILELTRPSMLGIWNDTEKRHKIFEIHFFEYPNLIQFKQVKTFFENIKAIKEGFAQKFDKDFQTKEILQLKNTCAWLKSIEADFLEYFDLLYGDDGTAHPVDKIEEKINVIRTRYGLLRKSYDDAIGF